MPIATSAMRKLAIDAAGLATSRVVQVGSRALYLVIAARMLGPVIYGQLNYAQSWYLMFLQFSMLGLQTIVARSVGKHGSKASETVGGATAAVLLASGILALVSGGIVAYLEPDPAIRIPTLIFSVAIFVRALAVWVEMLLVAYEHGRRVMHVTMLVRPLEPPLAFLLLYLGQGVAALATLHVVSWGVQLVIGYHFLSRHVDIPKPVWNLALLSRLALAGLPLMMAGGAVSFLQFGPVMMHRWLGGEGLGVLAILVQMISVLGVVPNSVMQTLLPALSRHTARDRANATRLPTLVAVLCLYGGAISAALTQFIAKPAVLILLGRNYLEAASSLWIAIATVGIYGAGAALNQSLVLRKQHYRVFLSTGCGLIAFVALRYLLTTKTPQSTLLCAAAGFVVWVTVGSIAAHLARSTMMAMAFCGIGLAILAAVDSPLGPLGAITILIVAFLGSGTLGKTRAYLQAR